MRIGIDLGGTKIEGLALDDDGRELTRHRVATPQGPYEETIAAIVTLVTQIERDTGARGSVGIGTPGALSPATALIKNANSTRLIGHPLDRDLERALGRPVRIANDANCFAVSEAVDGAAAGAAIVFGVILGTGCGGGIAIDGKAVTGANAIAGEWGHNPLPQPRPEEQPGPRCYCGRKGCIETFLSGPGLARDHAMVNGGMLTAEQIVGGAAGGDGACQTSLERYIDRLARALGSVINILDPNCIVLGGGMSNCRQLYERVPAIWSRYIFSDHVGTRLLPPKHGDSSGVRGAAWLWND
ncbi:MAG: transcriptional regulator [Alphaproteobacteria bacterium]|jgi:fructokinase|nr:transcriptional regulator [Alphaproteobacteria bacterium]